MAGLLDELKERVTEQGESTASVGFSLEGGRALVTYDFTPQTEEDLPNIISSILGYTVQGTSGYGMQRVPPVAHPEYPFLYASSITSIKGRGGRYAQTPSNPELEVPTLAEYASFPHYEITVEFTPRPYAVTTDDRLPDDGVGNWFDDTNNPKKYAYAREWLRYTDYEYQPKFESITATQGAMFFHLKSGTSPDHQRFEGTARMFLPDQILKVIWFAVPYRYLTSSKSYLNRWVGRINQGDWYNWTKGQLLYVGYTPKRYSPPIPSEINFDPLTLSTEKLVNIELNFVYTSRETTDPPEDYPGKFTLAGHNALPWLASRQFYYADSQFTGAGAPSFLSFPIELLFTDPDFPQIPISQDGIGPPWSPP